MLEWVTAGESHGRALVGVISGVPSGIQLNSQVISDALARRRLGYGRGARQKFEADALTLISGVRHGRTLGSPIAVEIGNSEWDKWTTVMSPDPVDPADLLIDAGTGDEREVARNRKLTKPRPGHADLPGMLKFDHTDARNVLERASARETAARVALGAVAKEILNQIAGVEIVSQVRQVGSARLDDSFPLPAVEDKEALDKDPMHCLDPEVSQKMIAEIDAAKNEGDTLGGIFEVVAYGMPIGVGSYTQGSQRLEAALGSAIMSIQAVKGFEVGDGFALGTRRGSASHDPIVRLENGSIGRDTNRAGGLEGGMTNGEPLVIRAALKPISTLPRALATIDLDSGEAAVGLHQRSDTCAIVPAAIIGEEEVALVLAKALLEKFGGDSLRECRENLAAWYYYCQERLGV